MPFAFRIGGFGTGRPAPERPVPHPSFEAIRREMEENGRALVEQNRRHHEAGLADYRARVRAALGG